MSRQQNAIIYRVKCNVTGEDFIDSTTLTLNQQLQQHKLQYQQFMDGTNKQYSVLHKVMDAEDFDVVVLEEHSCDSKEDLSSRIRYWEAKCSFYS